MKTSRKNKQTKKMLALVHLINCKLFQSFYKHKIIPGNSFHIPSVLKAWGLPRNKLKMKPIIKGKSPVIAFVHLYEYAAVRAGVPWRSTQESNFETSR